MVRHGPLVTARTVSVAAGPGSNDPQGLAPPAAAGLAVPAQRCRLPAWEDADTLNLYVFTLGSRASPVEFYGTARPSLGEELCRRRSLEERIMGIAVLGAGACLGSLLGRQALSVCLERARASRASQAGTFAAVHEVRSWHSSPVRSGDPGVRSSRSSTVAGMPG